MVLFGGEVPFFFWRHGCVRFANLRCWFRICLRMCCDQGVKECGRSFCDQFFNAFQVSQQDWLVVLALFWGQQGCCNVWGNAKGVVQFCKLQLLFLYVYCVHFGVHKVTRGMVPNTGRMVACSHHVSRSCGMVCVVSFLCRCLSAMQCSAPVLGVQRMIGKFESGYKTWLGL